MTSLNNWTELSMPNALRPPWPRRLLQGISRYGRGGIPGIVVSVFLPWSFRKSRYSRVKPVIVDQSWYSLGLARNRRGRIGYIYIYSKNYMTSPVNQHTWTNGTFPFVGMCFWGWAVRNLSIKAHCRKLPWFGWWNNPSNPPMIQWHWIFMVPSGKLT